MNVLCDVCSEPVLSRGMHPVIAKAFMRGHYLSAHPGVMPYACDNCFYIPPGVKGVRCTNIRDGVVCPIYTPRPVWLRT